MLELTATQRGIYLEGKLLGGAVNNIGGYQIYRCPIDPRRFTAARDLLLRTNDAYRLRFKEQPGECVPVVSDDAIPALTLIDYAQREDPPRAAAAWIEQRMQTAFGDICARTYEDALIRTAPQEWWYFVKAHHLIMDGISLALHGERLLALYKLPDGDGESPPHVGQFPSFVDYMRAQGNAADGKRYRDSREYWLEKLADAPEPVFMPRGGPENDGPTSGRVSRLVDGALLRDLSELAKQLRVGTASIVFAALYLYFSRCYSSPRLVFGAPVHNRRSAGERQIIGSIVNVNLVQVCASADTPFMELAQDIEQDRRRDMRHGSFPIADLNTALKGLGPDRQRLFDISFNYQRLPFTCALEGTPIETHFISHERERTPLSFVLCEYAVQEDSQFHLDHAFEFFDRAEAAQILEGIVRLLRQVCADPSRSLRDYALLSDDEQHRQLVTWNDTDMVLPTGLCIHDLFERQVARTPAAIALCRGEDSLTYQQLNDQASALAQTLWVNGVKPGDLVGVCLSRRSRLVVSLLAILKAGAAYVPLDPTYPVARIRHILEDARPRIVLTETGLQDLRGSCSVPTLYVDSALDASNGSGQWELHAAAPSRDHADRQLAYVIYTSGSTGQPKGVVIEHRSAVALIAWAQSAYTRLELQAVLASTSICFDLSVFEIFVPLAVGGRVVLVDNILSLHDANFAHPVTLINTVPSGIRALQEVGAIPRSVRCINLAGELLTQQLVDTLHALGPVRICDLYGPSEATTYSTCAQREKGGVNTIGRPIANTRAYVFDPEGELLPPGVPGELYLGGAGLARGYYKQPQLTQERFAYSPTAQARLYRTGDRVRWTRSGELQFLGRMDNQVKIRGYRVELGEVEAHLRRLELVKECAVVAGHEAATGTDQALLAYVILREPERADSREASDETAASLTALLGQSLPSYMCPATFLFLPALPLTPNGKVDRQRLPAPQTARRAHAGRRSDSGRHDVDRLLEAVLVRGKDSLPTQSLVL